MKKLLSKLNISGHTVAYVLGAAIAPIVCGVVATEAFVVRNDYSFKNDSTRAFAHVIYREILPWASGGSALIMLAACAFNAPTEKQSRQLLRRDVLSGRISLGDFEKLLDATEVLSDG